MSFCVRVCTAALTKTKRVLLCFIKGDKLKDYFLNIKRGQWVVCGILSFFSSKAP